MVKYKILSYKWLNILITSCTTIHNFHLHFIYNFVMNSLISWTIIYLYNKFDSLKLTHDSFKSIINLVWYSVFVSIYCQYLCTNKAKTRCYNFATSDLNVKVYSLEYFLSNYKLSLIQFWEALIYDYMTMKCRQEDKTGIIM